VGQHSRDEYLIKSFCDIFKNGNLKYYNNKNYIEFQINKFKIIYNKIIPLFKEYKIEGEKLLDFQDFCKIAELMEKKSHLTSKGLDQIREIKSRMNKARYLINKRV